MTTVTASPIRHPDLGSEKAMTVRGWWLVVLNVLIPGSAQVLAGNRRLGRFGLIFTFAMWVLLVATVVVGLLWRSVLLSLATMPVALTVLQVILAAYAIVWIILTFDTLRLVRIVRVTPQARPLIAAFAVILLFVSAGSAAYGATLAGAQRDLLNSVFSVQAAAEPPVDGRYNILLLGGDAGPDREGMRPDSISVVSIEASTGQATMFGIPRNLEDAPIKEGSPLIGSDYAPDGSYDCGSDCQISFLYPRVEAYDEDLYPDAESQGSLPGIEATKDAVEGALGITIQYYVLIDMQGFADLIDALGGVDIDVSERLPIGGDEDLNQVEGWIEPGMQHMDGQLALWYARSRHSTSDYDRMERQRQLQEAILSQFDPANVLSKFQGIASAGAQVVKTDIPQSTLPYFVELALKTKDLPITSIELTPPLIDPEDPDYDVIHQTVATALAPAPDSSAQ